MTKNRAGQLALVLTREWSALDNETTTIARNVANELAALPSKKREAEDRQAKALLELPGVVAKTASRLEAFQLAAKARARYEATQLFLTAALVSLVEARNENADKEDHLMRLQEVLNRKITWKSLDSTLKDTDETALVSELLVVPTWLIPSTPNQLTPEDVLRLIANAKLPEKPIGSGFQFRHPGINTTMIGLGLDVARAAELRVQEELNFVRQEIALLNGYENSLIQLKAKLDNDTAPTGDLAILKQRIGAKRDETPADTFQAMSDRYRTLTKFLATEKGFSSWIGIRRFVSAERAKLKGQMAVTMQSIYENFLNREAASYQLRFSPFALESLQARREARQADINLREREAFIGRGLDGLVAFHQGGITKDDIRALIELAAVAGIFTVAVD